MITTTSVAKSDNECTASAIIAVLWPIMPAVNLNITKRKFTKLPTMVTLYISFSLKLLSRFIGDSFSYFINIFIWFFFLLFALCNKSDFYAWNAFATNRHKITYFLRIMQPFYYLYLCGKLRNGGEWLWDRIRFRSHRCVELFCKKKSYFYTIV